MQMQVQNASVCVCVVCFFVGLILDKNLNVHMSCPMMYSRRVWTSSTCTQREHGLIYGVVLEDKIDVDIIKGGETRRDDPQWKWMTE